MLARNNLNVQIIGIGVGRAVSTSELEGVVSYPASSNAFFVKDYTSLSSIVSSVTHSECNQDNECTSNPCQNGASCTDLINGYTCDCVGSFTGKNCDVAGTGRLDINIVIDVSGSIRSERLPAVLAFMQSFVDNLEISPSKTHVGVLYYTDTAMPMFNMNTYSNKHDIMYEISRVQYTAGRTNTAAALQLLMSTMFTNAAGDRVDAQNVVIFVTDGNSNINSQYTIPTAIRLHQSGAVVLVLAVGTEIGWDEVNGIASPPTNRTVFLAPSTSTLPSLLPGLVAACTNGDNECLSMPCQNGGTCYDLYFHYSCHCLYGYTGRQCERQCTRQMDIALVLDQANYLDPNALSWVVTFAQQLVYGLPVMSGNALVSVVTYGDDATVNFNFNTYRTVEDIVMAMTFSNMGSRSQLQNALRLLPYSVYTTTSGARRGVSPVTVIITDGWATPSDPVSVVDLANAARQQVQGGLQIYVVGVGPEAAYNAGNIQGMANGPNYISYVASADQINSAVNALLDKLCS
jgi:uncharacterized protein YegL